MELVRKNKKVEQLKISTVVQLPLEADINISDSKPDAKQVIYDRAIVKLDEVKAGTNKIWVKGKVAYQILYSTEKAQRDVAGMTGEIPFMQELYVDGVESQDLVLCNARMESYSVHIINSRKWNFAAKLMLQPKVQMEIEESFCESLFNDEENMFQQPKIEYQKQDISYLENIVSKKDLLRIHEEVKIPETYGGADEVDWKSAEIKNITFQVFQEKLVARGEIQVFLSYTEDGKEQRYDYEVTIPFNQTLVCQECDENVIADLAYTMSHEDVVIKENEDGENRLVNVELVLEIEMKLWKKEVASLISNVYGINCEVTSNLNQVHFMKLSKLDSFQEAISQRVHIDLPVQEVLHNSVRVEVNQCEVEENEIIIKGDVHHNTLFRMKEEEKGYGQNKVTIPFEVNYQLPGAESDLFCKAVPTVMEQQIMVKEEKQVEYMTELLFSILVIEPSAEETISDISLSEIDQEKYDALPGIMVHVVQKGDSLWKLGREYYMSVDMIKEINGLTADTIMPGDKLILMKMF